KGSGQEPPYLALLDIARDLTASLAAEDRYARLAEAVARVLPCDAVCVLRLDGDGLVPVAARGLSPEALLRRYVVRENPRLDAILRSESPLLFAADSRLADPFEGLLAGDERASWPIHACLGCRLTVGGEIVGALTADASDPAAFNAVPLRIVAAL